MDDDRDKPEISEREKMGITGGPGTTMFGIDAKHLNIDGDTTDEKLHHDKSWKTKIEEEPDEPGDA